MALVPSWAAGAMPMPGPCHRAVTAMADAQASPGDRGRGGPVRVAVEVSLWPEDWRWVPAASGGPGTGEMPGSGMHAGAASPGTGRTIHQDPLPDERKVSVRSAGILSGLMWTTCLPFPVAIADLVGRLRYDGADARPYSNGSSASAPPLPTDGEPEPSEPPTQPRWPAYQTAETNSTRARSVPTIAWDVPLTRRRMAGPVLTVRMRTAARNSPRRSGPSGYGTT